MDDLKCASRWSITIGEYWFWTFTTISKKRSRSETFEDRQPFKIPQIFLDNQGPTTISRLPDRSIVDRHIHYARNRTRSSKFTTAVRTALNKTSVISVRSFPFLSVPFLNEWLQLYIPSFMTSIIDQSENPFWQMTHHSLWTYSLNEFQRDLLYLSIECQFRAQRTRQVIWWVIRMTSCLSSTNQK